VAGGSGREVPRAAASFVILQRAQCFAISVTTITKVPT
jgi:hypothetical protein